MYRSPHRQLSATALVSGEFREIPLDVVWLYRGTYSGVDLDTIECGGNLILNR